MSVIVIQFITLDGIVSDPDGSGGTPAGGWAFRHGPETVAGDKFRLGSVLDNGVMLLGRTTWQLFSRLWPARDDPFSARMNAVPKLVASRTLADVSAWVNSRVIDGDIVGAVKRERRDVIITGDSGRCDAQPPVGRRTLRGTRSWRIRTSQDRHGPRTGTDRHHWRPTRSWATTT